jgi:hypothetical protein
MFIVGVARAYITRGHGGSRGDGRFCLLGAADTQQVDLVRVYIKVREDAVATSGVVKESF